MNAYFLVEGRRTERKVYPKWIEILLPSLTKVDTISKVSKGDYFLISGNGYPSIIDHTKNSIADIKNTNVFTDFVICIDAEERTVEEVKSEFYDIILNENPPDDLDIHIIIQNKCFETWFLGNRPFVRSHPHSNSLVSYLQHYNVKVDDPELMTSPYRKMTSAQFHTDFFKKVARERQQRYSKNNAAIVCTQHFLNELTFRNKDTNHINTFANFLELIELFKNKLAEG